MITQFLMLEEIAKERRNELLKEAEAYRQMRQVKRQHPQAVWLKRAANRSIRFLWDHVHQAADQALSFTNGTIPAAKRK